MSRTHFTRLLALLLVAGGPVLGGGPVLADDPVDPEPSPDAATTGPAIAGDPGRTAEPEATDAAPFGDVVGRNWAAWSGGRDTVERADLSAAAGNPAWRGEDAAALAALQVHLRKAGPIDRATAVAIDDPRTLRNYRRNVAKLRGAARVLFAPGAPTLTTIEQGPAGDCHFVSAVGWNVLRRPDVVRRAIQPLPDGGHRVTFPDGSSATISAPTDTELALQDSAATLRTGLWMAVLEKAAGTVRARGGGKAAAAPDPVLAIDVPGGPQWEVQLWTGRRPNGFALGTRAHLGKLRAALVRMHDRGLMAEVLLRNRPAAKLPWDHVYAVLDFDPASDVLTLWNPWGTDFRPQGPSGPENGYARDRGVFRIPLGEFVAFFTYLSIEEG